MHSFIRATFAALVFCCSTVANSQQAVPEALRDWQGWVLEGEEFRRCPFLASTNLQPGEPIDAVAFRCAWPERLVLDVDARGGTFTQRWQIHADSWVVLPGNLEHWPQDVRLDGVPGPVIARNGVPSLRLAPGTYSVAGRFTWTTRPEALPVPPSTALVDLRVDNQRVAQPERPDGAIWLGKRRSEDQPAAMEVQVYRLVRDQVPTYLLTRIRLNVAGDAREVLLGRVLPDGYTPLSLTGGVPARLERDGRLRVQVRAGSHEITLLARAPTVMNDFARPDPQSDQWPREEIWSFEAVDALRVAAAEGPEGIDPVQANVPGEWQMLPAFRMDADSKLTVVERSRGLGNVDDNRLSLVRNLWLDFDHAGYTAVDQVSGSMRRDWRLDMNSPFELESATLEGEPVLVTEGADGRTGVEVRSPQLNLGSIARVDAHGGMPATGWNQRFDAVRGVLHLPPGHRLLAATGVDAAPNSWFERWGLWSVFGIALIVVFVYWTAGRVPAAIAAVALLLTYQEMPPFIWLWGNLLAALAIARAAPEGKFRKLARGYRTVSFVILAIALLPFMWQQVRFALHPQLESLSAWNWPGNPATSHQYNLMYEQAPAADAAAMAAEDLAMPAPAAAAPPMESSADESRNAIRNLVGKRLDPALNAQMVMQRYASGTRLQAGPGLPGWRYVSYAYSWSGPVEAADTVRFIYLGPIAMFIWRIIGVAALVLLYLVLARLSYGGNWRLPGEPQATPEPVTVTGHATSLALPVLLSLGLLVAASPSRAQEAAESPGSELLAELKQRLTKAPACAPNCAELAEARVTVDGERLEIVMRVSALANLAVAMPHANDRWQLEDVSVDARASLAIAREGYATLWVPLSAGAHTVRLAGRLAAAESIQVAFPQAPRVIQVNARGWTVSGVNEGRLVSGSLELARERVASQAGSAEALEAGAQFPPFVRVERLFNLDLDWTVHTLVTRVAPLRAAVSVQIPLVPGESVLTPGVEIRDGQALVGLGTGQDSMSWVSGLVRGDTLEVSLPDGTPRAEEWIFLVNPQWHVEFEGFPAVMPATANNERWQFRFIPRPGEKLVARVSRPKGIDGATLAIDSVRYKTEAGNRSSNSSLTFDYRSTQGGRHTVKLPPDARVTAVLFDDQPVQLRPEKGELPLALSPGKHSVQVDWEESGDIGLRTRLSPVDLGSPASNVTATIHMPASRWPLFVIGPGVGPAVLYWGELVVFVAIAWLLGRWKKSPLTFVEWLLLGLGLSTQSWWAFSVTAAWLLVMRWRESWQPAEDARLRFNIVQVLLAAFTVFAILTLLFLGIRNGLLSAPDMGVEGAGSGRGTFTWFDDQAKGPIDTPAVYSVPMFGYRFLFLAWAFWMAFALVKWLRRAFNAWKTGGLWR